MATENLPAGVAEGVWRAGVCSGVSSGASGCRGAAEGVVLWSLLSQSFAGDVVPVQCVVFYLLLGECQVN